MHATIPFIYLGGSENRVLAGVNLLDKKPKWGNLTVRAPLLICSLWQTVLNKLYLLIMELGNLDLTRNTDHNRFVRLPKWSTFRILAMKYIRIPLLRNRNFKKYHKKLVCLEVVRLLVTFKVELETSILNDRLELWKNNLAITNTFYIKILQDIHIKYGSKLFIHKWRLIY